MTVPGVLAALRRWWWVLVLCPLLAATAAGAGSALVTPVWEGQASILVRPAQNLTALGSGTDNGADQVAHTYAVLMVERSLLSQVISDLGLHTTPERLAKEIKVAPKQSTTVLSVAARDTDRARARDIANRLVETFIAQTGQRQQARVDRYTEQLHGQIADVERAIAADQAAVNDLTAQASVRIPTPDQQARLASLQQQLAGDRERDASLARSLAEVNTQAISAMDTVDVLSRAVLPDQPVSPDIPLNVLVTAAAALLVALGLVALADHLDQSIKGEAGIVERTGLPVIGHVPFQPALAVGGQRSAVLGERSDLAAEAYKRLRTNLLFSAVERELGSVVITSPAAGEGKSETAANLALSLAEAGHDTLLVDADFRRPRQHGLFGRIRNVGLTNLLIQDADEAEALLPVAGHPRLFLVTSGPTPPNPSELLGSSRMRALISRWEGQYAFVVIDSPPVNVVTDAAVIAALAGTTVLVVADGETGFPALARAQAELARVGARIAGVVINKARSRRSDSYYYGRYEQAAQTPEPERPRLRAARSRGGRG